MVNKDENKVENSGTYELTPTQEEYIRIYHEYFALNWTWNDICKYHNCSKMKVSNAIHWVIDNRLKVPPTQLVKGAIDAILVRVKRNKELLDTELAKKYKDNNFVIALNREIREDEKTVFEMQKIYGEPENSNDNLSAAQVLSLIKAAQTTSTDQL